MSASEYKTGALPRGVRAFPLRKNPSGGNSRFREVIAVRGPVRGVLLVARTRVKVVVRPSIYHIYLYAYL